MPKDHQFVDLPAKHRDEFVYRIIPLEYVYQLLGRGENVLVSPSLWKDPFEHFILQSNVVSRRGWFGQCWTRHKASDAIWRIYSAKNHGVRIRSTPRRLLLSLSGAFGQNARAFIGEVEYLRTERVVSRARWKLLFGNVSDPLRAARTLLVKRPAFRHEAEVRLLLCRPGSTSTLAQYRLASHDVVDQLMLDPRLDRRDADRLKAKIRDRTGYLGTIKRSLLYAPPPSLV
jgi:hypothetical protein